MLSELSLQDSEGAPPEVIHAIVKDATESIGKSRAVLARLLKGPRGGEAIDSIEEQYQRAVKDL